MKDRFCAKQIWRTALFPVHPMIQIECGTGPVKPLMGLFCSVQQNYHNSSAGTAFHVENVVCVRVPFPVSFGILSSVVPSVHPAVFGTKASNISSCFNLVPQRRLHCRCRWSNKSLAYYASKILKDGLALASRLTRATFRRWRVSEADTSLTGDSEFRFTSSLDPAPTLTHPSCCSRIYPQILPICRVVSHGFRHSEPRHPLLIALLASSVAERGCLDPCLRPTSLQRSRQLLPSLRRQRRHRRFSLRRRLRRGLLLRARWPLLHQVSSAFGSACSRGLSRGCQAPLWRLDFVIVLHVEVQRVVVLS